MSEYTVRTLSEIIPHKRGASLCSSPCKVSQVTGHALLYCFFATPVLYLPTCCATGMAWDCFVFTHGWLTLSLNFFSFPHS